MPEQELADQFSRDVDELLKGHRPDRAAATPNYRLALDIAQALAATDLGAESRQRAALRRRLLSQISAPEKPAPAEAKSLALWLGPLGRQLAAGCGVVLAIGIIHLAWSGALHHSATNLSTGLSQNLGAVPDALPETAPEYAAPITATVRLIAESWLAPSSPEALAVSQIPSNSTTIPLGNVTAFGPPSP